MKRRALSSLPIVILLASSFSSLPPRTSQAAPGPAPAPAATTAPAAAPVKPAPATPALPAPKPTVVPTRFETAKGNLTAAPAGPVTMTYHMDKGTVSDQAPGTLKFSGTVKAPPEVPVSAKCSLAWQLESQNALSAKFVAEAKARSTDKSSKAPELTAKGADFSAPTASEFGVSVPFSFTVKNPLSLIGVSCVKAGTTVRSAGYQLNFPRLFLNCYQATPGQEKAYYYRIDFPQPEVSFSVSCAAQ